MFLCYTCVRIRKGMVIYMTNKERFIEIYNKSIKREGSKRLLDYLQSPSCDFFTAPASTRYHGAYEGGLLEHSLNVYDCLTSYLERPEAKEKFSLDYSDESVAIVALLHDICKTNVYKKDFRNVKDETGTWIKVPTFKFDDTLPYGHGEKSVYIISGFMRLTRDEAFAIRYHMGFSGEENKNTVGNALICFRLHWHLTLPIWKPLFFLRTETDKLD